MKIQSHLKSIFYIIGFFLIIISESGCLLMDPSSSAIHVGKYELNFVDNSVLHHWTLTGEGYTYLVSKKTIFGKYRPTKLSTRIYYSKDDTNHCYVKVYKKKRNGELKGKMIIDKCAKVIIRTTDVDNIKYSDN